MMEQMARDAQKNQQSKILRFCIGIILLSTVAAGCSKIGSSVDESRKTAMREMQMIATYAADLLNVYMDARVTEMLVCSKTSEQFKKAVTDPEARTGANRILGEWLKTSKAYDAIMLVDKTGVCVASAPAELVNHDFSDDSAFKGAIGGKLTLADAHKSDALASLDPKSKGWTATIAVPIKAGKDSVGVLMSYLKWSRLRELTRSMPVGKSGYVYVLNRENQVILHPAERLYGIGLRDRRINLPNLDDAVRRRLGTARYDFENVMTHRVDHKLVGFAYPEGYGNFPGLGWTVGAAADESELVKLPSWTELFR